MRLKLAAAMLIFSAPAMSQLPETENLDLALGLMKVVGLSAEGTQLMARRAVERTKSKAQQVDRGSAIEKAIGEQLARPSVDRSRLRSLIDQYAEETAAIERRRKTSEVEAALELSQADRQKLGRFLVSSAGASSSGSDRVR